MIDSFPPRDPLPVDVIADKFLAQIEPWAKKRGGTAEVVANLAHLWQKIYDVQLEDIPRLYICWNGDTPVGGEDESNTLCRNTNHWICVIMRGHGFKSLIMDGKGGDQTKPGSVEPFVTSIEQVRNLLRLTPKVTETPPITYRGTKPLPNLGMSNTANIFLDGFSIELSTDNDMIQIKDMV